MWEWFVFSFGSRSIEEFGASLLQAADLQQCTFLAGRCSGTGNWAATGQFQRPVGDSTSLEAVFLNFFVV